MPIQGITSEWLMNKMTLKNKKLSSKTELIHNIKQSNAVIKVVIGAGDIGEMVVDITKELSYES